MAAQLATLGGIGITVREGVLTIGSDPSVLKYYTEEDDNGPVGEPAYMVDNPQTVIGFADLLQALIDHNDKGGQTVFIGRVCVLPTAPNQKVSITDEGKVIVASD